MTWGKVDDKLWGSPKWLATGPRARALWVTALSWSMDQLTDGVIPAHVLTVLGGTRREAGALVAGGLWETHEDGWVFHDWADYQPSRAKILAEREAAAERQRHARERAKSQRESQRESQRDMGVSHGPPDPTRPDPSKSGGPSLIHSTTRSVPREEAS